MKDTPETERLLTEPSASLTVSRSRSDLLGVVYHVRWTYRARKGMASVSASGPTLAQATRKLLGLRGNPYHPVQYVDPMTGQPVAGE